MIYHVLSIKYVKLDYVEVKQNMITGYLAGYLFQNTYNKDENNFKQNINALLGANCCDFISDINFDIYLCRMRKILIFEMNDMVDQSYIIIQLSLIHQLLST